MAKRILGSFEIVEKLGVGGMGVVYRATYTKTGQTVALKVLSPTMNSEPKLIARFEREIKILKRLRDPHIVRYYGGGEKNGQRYFAMELVDGGTLDGFIKKRGGRLTWEQAVDVGKQVCRALEHAHNAGIVHRDLKPGNMLLTRKGRLKLGDFGIARDTEATALTAAGKTVGTYAYMAPEQILGKPPVSRKTDLYSLGCVLFEVLAGRPPFEATTPAEMLFQHMEADPPQIRTFARDCPIWLEDIISRLLQKDPDDRPYDALAVHEALNEVLEKVANQESIAAQTMSGGVTATQEEKKELVKILRRGRKRKKRRGKEPFWERTWFLGTMLSLVLALIVWLAWPLNEEEIFKLASDGMASDDVAVRDETYDRYIVPYLEDYPEGQFNEQMKEWDQSVKVNRLERQIERRFKGNREPKSEPERMYHEARKLEQMGDRYSAVQKLTDIVNLTGSSEDERLMALISQQRIDQIQAKGSLGSDSVQFVAGKLREAEELADAGKRIEAQQIWRSIESTYAANQELSQHVAFARARLDNKEPPPLDLDSPPPEQSSDSSEEKVSN